MTFFHNRWIKQVIYKIQHIELLRTAHTAQNFDKNTVYSKEYRTWRIVCFALMFYFIFPFIPALFEIVLGFFFLISSADHIFRAFTDILYPVVNTDWYKWYLSSLMEHIFGNGIYAIRFVLSFLSFFIFFSITVFKVQKEEVQKNRTQL